MVTTIAATLEGFLLPFAQYFRNKNWQVDAMAQGISTSNDCLQAFDRVWDVEWSRNPLDPRNLLVAPRKIQEVIAQGKYDIVHVHTPVAAFVTRYTLKRIKKQGPKIIYTAHGFHFHNEGTPFKNKIFLTLEKLAGRWTDYLIVINHEDEKAAKQHQIVSPNKVRYLPGIGVDLSYYNPNTVSEAEVAKVDQELKLAGKNPLFLTIAEFISRKRHQDILRALALLGRSEVHLAFAGNGPLQEEMKQLATQLGVQNQVHFLGLRQDISTLICASRATILASEQEGLPRSVMESLCLEKPVIGTAIRGTRDLLAQGGGILFPVGDVEELAKAMNWILDHPKDAKLMGKQGRKQMDIYSLDNVLLLSESLYTEALGNSLD